ncbi:MAG: SET domain-containing protein-lysine N-methyltransferase [Spirochaetota bacterium]
MKINIDKKRKITNNLAICECEETKHKSLFTNSNITKGQIISKIHFSQIAPEPNYLTVQLKNNQHITLEPEYLQYINHSCDPNVILDTTHMHIQAIHDIPAGEQLTFFYPSTEWNMAQGFICLCGATNCLKHISGAAHIPKEILKQYHLSGYIQRQISESSNN